jgi:SAM-dependent methyltransferase
MSRTNTPTAQLPLSDSGWLEAEATLWTAQTGNLLLQQIPLRKNLRILEVGCGTGMLSRELAHRLDAGSLVTATDPFEACIARAYSFPNAAEPTNLSYRWLPDEQLPFENKSFDIIFSNLGFWRYPDPDALLLSCRDKLKKTGRLFLTAFTEGHFRELYDSLEAVLKQLRASDRMFDWARALSQQHGTDESLREWLETTGFSVVRVGRERSFCRFTDGSSLLQHYLVRQAVLFGWKERFPDGGAKVLDMLEKELNEKADWEGEIRITTQFLLLEAVN